MLRQFIQFVIAVTFSAAIAGCGNPVIDYKPSTPATASRIHVTSTSPVLNHGVLVHGRDVCNVADAQVAARLSNLDRAMVQKAPAVFFAPSNEQIKISLPSKDMTDISGGKLHYQFVQHVLIFTPEPNQTYEIEFTRFGATAYRLAGSDLASGRTSIAPSSLDRTCRVTNQNLGDDRTLFFLVNQAP